MRILSVTSRTITLELDNNLPYYSENDFSIYLNNEFIRRENRNVFTIFDLTPNQKYSLIIDNIPFSKLYSFHISKTILLIFASIIYIKHEINLSIKL